MPLFPMDSGVKNSYNEMRLKSLLKSTYFSLYRAMPRYFFCPQPNRLTYGFQELAVDEAFSDTGVAVKDGICA